MILGWLKSDLGVVFYALALIDWLWSPIEEFLYKENVRVLGEMLSNFFQNPYFCFGHNLTISHPNWVIPIGKKP